MTVRLVHPPRASAGETDFAPLDFPPAANESRFDDDEGLWFPCGLADDLRIAALVLLCIALAAVIGLYGSGPQDYWFSLWGIAK